MKKRKLPIPQRGAKTAKIRALIALGKSNGEIAEIVGTLRGYVWKVRWRDANPELYSEENKRLHAAVMADPERRKAYQKQRAARFQRLWYSDREYRRTRSANSRRHHMRKKLLKQQEQERRCE